MAYFKQFPKSLYDYNNDGVLTNVVDIYRSVRPVQNFVDSVSAYRTYEIKDGERPDIVSQRLYGTSRYYWTFFIINEFLHDGLAVWPMSTMDLQTYIDTEYEGWAITTNPSITRNTDNQIIDFANSLAGRFQIGETILGGTSGGTGTLTKKDLDLNQLVIQNATGNFFGTPGAINNSTELVIGQTSEDSVSTYEAWKYAEAPHHYYLNGDTEKRAVTNALHIQGGIGTNSLTFQSNRNYMFEKNLNDSFIRIIDPTYVRKFASKFEKLINV